MSLIYTFIANPFAIKWGAWFFSDDKIIGRILGFPIGDLVFAVLVAITISSAILVFIHLQESGRFKILLGK